ncbi:hypothetical protein AB6806_28200 [Bosea sp. RCC_152_1]|uniref:hypothetical protein n=1 Tax=Bosea sp. RCC_152_1 TaxID=3239228 RepID=UPI003525BC9D
MVRARNPVNAMPSSRAITIAGEQAMSIVEAEGRILLDGYADDLIRSYAAAGLLTAALDELTSGISREVAIETLKGALLTLEALPS